MQTRCLPVVLALLIVLGFTPHYQKSWAGRVVKVKGKKVYIKLSKKEAKKLSKGDKLYLTTKSKKKKGIVVIRKKKGKKAIATLKKGKAKKNYLTRMHGKKKKKGTEDSMNTVDDIAVAQTDAENYSDIMVGLMGSFMMMEQNVASEVPVVMTGFPRGAKIVLDYSLTESFGLLVRAGMNLIQISGTDEKDNTSETKIDYLAMDLLGRYYFFRTKKFGAFINAGAGVYSPLSPEVSGDPPALDQDTISTTTLGIGGLGLQYSFGGWQLFASFDYFYFPPSDTVETTAFGGNLGILFPF